MSESDTPPDLVCTDAEVVPRAVVEVGAGRREMLVWYCSYGSNLNAARFATYILGGRFEGAAHTHAGCRDPTLPRRAVPWALTGYRLFFRMDSTWWGGLVCGIEAATNEDCVQCRCYLVTREQFEDVTKQENGLSVEDDLPGLDYAHLHRERSATVLPGAGYGHLLLLGELDGFPVLSFTHAPGQITRNDALRRPYKTASANYLRTIARGLSEHMTDDEVVAYLRGTEGIAGHWADDALRDVAAAARAARAAPPPPQ